MFVVSFYLHVGGFLYSLDLLMRLRSEGTFWAMVHKYDVCYMTSDTV